MRPEDKKRKSQWSEMRELKICLIIFFSFSVINLLAISDEASIEQDLTQFSLEGYTNDGHKKWVLEGAEARLGSEKVDLANVKIVSYAKEDEIEISLVAEKGYFDKETRNVTLEKSVTVLSNEGFEMTTDVLNWDGDSELVWTDSPIRICKENIILSGVGAKGYPSFKEFTLNKEIRVVISPEEYKEDVRTVISCDGPMTIDYEKDKVLFENGVIVDRTDGEIAADKLEVFLTPDRGNIIKTIATGNVKVESGGNSCYGDRAVYDGLTKKITLEGHPRFVIYTETRD